MRETVLISIASPGVGKDLVIQFAADGSSLILVARSEDKLEDLRHRFLSVSKSSQRSQR